VFKYLAIAFAALSCLLASTASAVVQQPWQGEKAVGILEAWNGGSAVPDSVVLVVQDSSGGAYLLLCRNNPMQGVDPLGLCERCGDPTVSAGG